MGNTKGQTSSVGISSLCPFTSYNETRDKSAICNLKNSHKIHSFLVITIIFGISYCSKGILWKIE